MHAQEHELEIAWYAPVRGRANMAHVRQSGPDSGFGVQAKVLKTFQMCSLFARKRLISDGERSEEELLGPIYKIPVIS